MQMVVRQRGGNPIEVSRPSNLSMRLSVENAIQIACLPQSEFPSIGTLATSFPCSFATQTTKP
jgi:hypothetical protein